MGHSIIVCVFVSFVDGNIYFDLNCEVFECAILDQVLQKCFVLNIIIIDIINIIIISVSFSLLKQYTTSHENPHALSKSLFTV